MEDPMGTVPRPFPCQEPPDGGRAHLQEQLPCLVLKCEVPRSEVNPEARKKGHSGRVVEIGTLNHAGERPSSQPESAVVDALADALLQVRSLRTSQISGSRARVASAESGRSLVPRSC